MTLGHHDLHIVVSEEAQLLRVWNAEHEELMSCECHSRALAPEADEHHGPCPKGQYQLGLPVLKDEPAFGRWFLPILDVTGAAAADGRGHLGIHGGGSDLPDPFANHQGWERTEGCLRVQNFDLGNLAAYVRRAIEAGGRVYLTVG